MTDAANVTATDISKLVAQVKKMPGAGDQQHVQAIFPVYGKKIPPTPKGAWDNAKLKFVKFKKLEATNGQLDRNNLIWHLENPGKSKMRSAHNTHPQVMKTKGGDLIIVDGHHRLSALKLLRIKKTAVWKVKEKDMTGE